MKIGQLSAGECLVIAKELSDCGITSCAEVETGGGMVTRDPETRDLLDFWLALFERHRQCCGDGKSLTSATT